MKNLFKIKEYNSKDALSVKIRKLYRDRSNVLKPSVVLVTANKQTILVYRMILRMFSKYFRIMLRPSGSGMKLFGNLKRTLHKNNFTNYLFL